jgi:hypothetical protein
MFGKLAALIVAGFAALVSSQDFRVSEQLKSRRNSMELIPKTSELAVGAYPAGFLSGSQLVNDLDRQWIWDKLAVHRCPHNCPVYSNIPFIPGIGTLHYRNADGYTFVKALTRKNFALFLLRGEENRAVFGAFIDEPLLSFPAQHNQNHLFEGSDSPLFNVDDKKIWYPSYTKDCELIKTADTGSSKWIKFGERANGLTIRNTNGFQAAASTANPNPHYAIKVDANGINQLTKALDGKEIKLSDMEIWEL